MQVKEIAYLTGEYPRATDTFIQREIQGLRDLGVEIQAISVRKPKKDHIVGREQEYEYQHAFYVLPVNVLKVFLVHLVLVATSFRSYFESLKLAYQTRPPGLKAAIYQIFYFIEAGLVVAFMKKRGIKHLHNHFANSSCSLSMIASAMGGFTYSFTMHGPAIFFEPHKWRIDEKIKRAQFVSCISYFCRSQAMIFSDPKHWDKLRIIHCGVEVDRYRLRSHSGRGTKVLYVGRLAAVKGLSFLLEAVSHIPDVVLTVVGDGEDRQWLESQATVLGVAERVHFVGYKSQSEVQAYLDDSDVFVMSSFAEGVPVVLMEAMASGVPVIATKIAGVSELVEDGVNGILVPPGDAVALSSSMVQLLADEACRRRMGEAGREKVLKDFNIAHEARKLKTLFEEYLSGASA